MTLTEAVKTPDPTRRCQVYAEAAALLQATLDDMARLATSTAALQTHAAAARRQGVKLPLEGCLDTTLDVRVAQCQKVAKRLTRLAAAGG